MIINVNFNLLHVKKKSRYMKHLKKSRMRLTKNLFLKIY